MRNVRYKITTGGMEYTMTTDHQKAELAKAQAWLAALPFSAYQEFGALLEASFTFTKLAMPLGILYDFLEEHGGQRVWWAWFFPLWEVPEVNANAPRKGKRRSCRAA